jgi:hypothetical protein
MEEYNWAGARVEVLGAGRSGSHATEVMKVFPGTRVQLLSPREHDESDKGFVDWKFLSVLSWGENPRGTWVLDIVDKVSRLQETSSRDLHFDLPTRIYFIAIAPRHVILNFVTLL